LEALKSACMAASYTPSMIAGTSLA
jgi:hypothetical protein